MMKGWKPPNSHPCSHVCKSSWRFENFSFHPGSLLALEVHD
jgi:hypothetical protein